MGRKAIITPKNTCEAATSALWREQACLDGWQDALRVRLELSIPKTRVRIDWIRPDWLGQFDRTTREITIARTLVVRAPAVGWVKVLAVLLHEQIHYWHLLHGTPDGGSHGREFRAKALACGLVIDGEGVNKGLVPDGPFLRLLAERGVLS